MGLFPLAASRIYAYLRSSRSLRAESMHIYAVPALCEQNLSIFTQFPLSAKKFLSLFASFPPCSQCCKAVFVPICVIPALFAVLQSSLCRYLRHSRLVRSAAKQFLSLFASFPPCSQCCKAVFVAICIIPALFALLQSSFCRYLRHSRLVP